MITLPSLSAIPGIVSAGPADRLAAQCALALAAPGPIPRVRARKEPLEHALLKLELEAALFTAASRLRIFRPRLHTHLGSVPAMCECCGTSQSPITVWLGNANGDALDSRWTLERRWRELERAAPGLPSTALHVLERASFCVPLYTPHMALGMAQWTYWHGENDESWILEEYRDAEEYDETEKPMKPEELAEHFGIITRARIDNALPPFVTAPKRALKLEELERLARGRGAGKEAAAKTASLWHATNVAGRAEPAFALHTQQDETWALGFGAMLRWNARDPMGRILDDHANNLFESSAVEEAWGWFVVRSAGELRSFFAHLEERFAIARQAEELIEKIAERARP